MGGRNIAITIGPVEATIPLTYRFDLVSSVIVYRIAVTSAQAFDFANRCDQLYYSAHLNQREVMSQPAEANGQKQPEANSSSSNIPVKQDICNIPGKVSWVLWRTNFDIDPHYTPIKAIGKGAYGVVCSAKNALTTEKVAIKKIGNAFDNLTDARRTLREIKLLRHLRHENIIAIKDIMKSSRDKFNDVYLVYELMDTDLHQIIRSSQPLTNEHFQYFIYQVRRYPAGSPRDTTGLLVWGTYTQGKQH